MSIMSGSPQKKTRGMKFAEQQLQRHGWKQGKGLGKRENGISEAIKVKVKCDTAGVGHVPSEQFTFHWWDHLFNKSAANISVEAGQDGVQMKKLSEQDGEISNKKPRKAPSATSMLYGRFVKAATLTAGGEEPTKQVSTSESSEDEEEKLDMSTVRKLTDEELVQACGGRTAHKGARHGLTMRAKLARLEEQEQAFLAKYSQEEQMGSAPMQQQEAAVNTPGMEGSTLAEGKAKKKKRRRRSKERGSCAEAGGRPEPAGEEEQRARKRKKKNRRRREEGREEERAEDSEKSELLDSREQLMAGARQLEGPHGDSPRKRTKKKKKQKGHV
ncbi:G patch domain-containing protein 4 [Pelodiscus sinensis]|uniref:G patch domain-containing protein 4 n=1 Tax=Pelodiscus sinensis TaxID=13735 RepID=UPI003F6BEEF9